MLKKVFCLAALLAGFSSAAYALTVEELTAHSWMSTDLHAKSCDLPPLITFKKDGTLAGEPGCNNLFGNYEIGRDGAFLFDKMGMTRKLCAKHYMDQEEKFVSMLNNTRYAKKEGDKIIFYDENRKELGTIEPEKSGGCF
jgi:heat shock protein HslJ